MFKKRKGQTAILFALAVVAILSFVALGLDGASLLLQRRIAQNAADAASLAGGRVLAVRGGDSSATTEKQVLETVNKLAQENQIDLQGQPLDQVNPEVEAYFLDAASDVIGTKIGTNGGIPSGVVGVRVRPSKSTASLIAHVVGVDRVGAAANCDTLIYQSEQSQYSPESGLLPIGVPETVANTTSAYNLWTPQNGYTGDAQYKGLLDFNDVTGSGYINDPSDDSMNKPGSINYWTTYGFKGRIADGNDVGLVNGDLGNNCASGLRAYVNNHALYDDPLHPTAAGKYGIIYVPIYQYPIAENQASGTVHIKGFAAFKLYYNDISSSSASGYWVSYVDAEGIPGDVVSDPVHYRGPVVVKLSE